jgi:hypothetical protein
MNQPSGITMFRTLFSYIYVGLQSNYSAMGSQYCENMSLDELNRNKLKCAESIGCDPASEETSYPPSRDRRFVLVRDRHRNV